MVGSRFSDTRIERTQGMKNIYIVSPQECLSAAEYKCDQYYGIFPQLL